MQFVHEHGTALLRYARMLVPDDGEAEDLVQTALFRLCRHWGKHLDSPQAYARVALANLAKDRGRRLHLIPVPTDITSPADATPPAATTPDHAEAVAARARLDQLLTALPPRQRVTVVLRVIEGLSEAETAAVMRCSTGTVKSNLSRGLSRVRDALAPGLVERNRT